MSVLISMPKSDQKLLDALSIAVKRKQTQDDLLEQRISFVYGSLDAKSGVTRERVKQMILGQLDTATVK